ncbi:MAG TPA: DUF1778 domain-containing protein [Pseudonocardiaceae bacterium]|jgi:uncharacterized protein (DUF1778 family)|nr:DUF1778 domain-containing protein [Pseudonocardiaceae bacterium]
MADLSGVDRRPLRPYIARTGARTGSKEVIISSSKTERIEVRVSEREQEVLREAAEAEHMTVSAFILSTVVPRAQEVVDRNRDIRMSARAYEQFLAELDRPAESVPALRELFSRPRRIQFGES